MTEFQPENTRPQKAKSYLWLKILIPLGFVLIAATILIYRFAAAGISCDSFYSGLSEKVGSGSFSRKYEKLIEMNSDMSGFLTLDRENFGLPVVKPQKEDEQYYRSHLFGGKSNKYGTLTTKSEDNSSITVIKSKGFGDGRMLSPIEKWQKETYLKKYPVIYFDSSLGEGIYAVFSAFSYEGEEPFFIDRISFLNDGIFSDYIESMKENSKLTLDIDINTSDKLLVLICEEKDTTHILAARQLRSGESADSIDKASAPAAAEVTSSETPDTQSDSSSKSESSYSSQSGIDSTSSETSSDKSSTDYDADADSAPAFETNRIEQTGLTDNLDKTVKVEVGQVVTMVDVVGMKKASAKNTVENTLGLSVKIVEQESEEPRGTVIEQSVAAEAQVSTDITVTLYVSAGITSGNAIVPDLIGNAETSAEIVLDKYNLRLGKVTTQKSSLEKGTILSQSAGAGSEVAVNTKINITVSDGSVAFKTVKMPNLSGKTKKKAEAAIKAAGLKVGTVKTVTSSKSAGTVITQECPSGAKIEEGSTVGFSISNGSKVNNLTVTNQSSWSVTINGVSYAPGAIIKGDYMDIIPCVAEAEMGSGFNIEALKAQCVATYCWLINAGSKSGAAPAVPMKTPSSRAIKAAEAVSGIRVLSGGETAQTYYYAISAGYTANCKDVWVADIPYLRSVVSEGDKYASGYKTTISYSASKMKSMIKSAYGIDLSNVDKSKWFSIKYDENGAYVRSVNLGGKKTVSGSSIRETLCSYALRSTAFKVKYNKSTDKFTFTVYGYGHGIGMSQVGANYYAEQGWSYEQILTHYYPGTTVG